jgi:outer membrane protein
MAGRMILTILILLTCLPQLLAQESWNLERCINFALENNLTHHLYELDERTAKIDVTQSRLNLLPSISASSSAGISYGRSVDPNSNDVVNTDFFNSSGSLSSSIGLFRGFIQTNRIAYTKFRLLVSKWKKINYQDDLAFDVLTSYFDVIYYQGVVEITREQLQLSEFNLKKTEVQIETGMKAKTDLAEMQATYEKEMLSLIQAENKLDEVKLQLGQLMNLTANQLRSLNLVNEKEEPVAVIGPSAADSLFDEFVRISPYVKMAQAELDAASKSVAIARGQYFPSINLGASVSTAYYETNQDNEGNTIPFNTQFDNNMSQYIGASLSIPIFGRNEVRSGVRKAKLAREQAETQLDLYRQTVYYELANNTRDLYALSREYLQTKKQLEANELAYKVAQRKYDEGLIDVIEMLTVKNRVAESKSQFLAANLQWRIKSRIIDFYKGIRFWDVTD